MKKEHVDGQEFERDPQQANPQEGDAANESENVNMSEDCPVDNDNSANGADNASDWRDKYMRLSAEFDNYRKRTLKEKMDLISSASEDVIKAILPVVDDMERAIQAMENTENSEKFLEGTILIYNKLKDTLKNKGVLEIEALGRHLDTDEHEAVAKIPAPDDQKGRIVDVIQKGFKLKDKVIRYSKVVVGE